MALFTKKRSPEDKKVLEADYQKWLNEHVNPTLSKILNFYAKAATILFFGLVLLEFYIDLGALYLIFPLFFALHLALILIFPAYFSLLPSYSKPRSEKESYPVGIFLLIPSIFPIFYLLRGASWKLWAASAVFALLMTALLLLRYRKEVKAYFSFSIFYEFFMLTMAIFGALVMTNSLVAEHNLVDTAPVTLIEKTQNDNAYTFTIESEDGEALAYNVSEAMFSEKEFGDTLYIETYEGLFGIQFTKLTDGS